MSFTQIQTMPRVVPLPSRVQISQEDLTLSFIISKDIGDFYEMVYNVQILTKEQRMNPTIKLPPRSIDMASLRMAILSKVNAFDRKYMELKKFDARYAIFHFNVEKWLNDALMGVNPRTELSKFSRTVKFRIKIPFMMLQNPMVYQFEDFLIRNFKKYMEKKRVSRQWFRYLFPQDFHTRAREAISNMFDYSYDMQWNLITITLKTFYVMALLFSVGLVAYQVGKQEVDSQWRQQRFARNVEANVPRFDYKRWEKFIKTRRI